MKRNQNKENSNKQPTNNTGNSQGTSDPATTETSIKPSQKLKDVMGRSKQYVHSVQQIIIDEHHFLNVGSSILTGQPVYTLWNDEGSYFRGDVDGIKPDATFSHSSNTTKGCEAQPEQGKQQ